MDLLHVKASVSQSRFNTHRNSAQGSLINYTTPNSTEYVIQVVYPAMKLILVFALVFFLGALAKSIPQQEDTQVLESKQNDPSVNYLSGSLNRLKREIASGLLIHHRTQSPLIGSVILYLLYSSSHSFPRLALIFLYNSLGRRARLSHSPTTRVLGKSRFSQTVNQIFSFSLRYMITVYRN